MITTSGKKLIDVGLGTYSGQRTYFHFHITFDSDFIAAARRLRSGNAR
jgi:aromatic ring-cleaving dioxygenase